MKRVFIVAAMTIVAAALGFAQGLPTSQPNLIQIIREGVKAGHEFDHVRTEADGHWPLRRQNRRITIWHWRP